MADFMVVYCHAPIIAISIRSRLPACLTATAADELIASKHCDALRAKSAGPAISSLLRSFGKLSRGIAIDPVTRDPRE